MKIAFQITETFPTTAKNIYNSWLDSELHTLMTGGAAECSKETGGKFSAWDGYISGSNISLDPGKEIVQTWRTTEFADSDEDSKLTIQLKDFEQGCELTLIHENIPEGQHSYRQGWVDHYFNPMKAYFSK